MRRNKCECDYPKAKRKHKVIKEKIKKKHNRKPKIEIKSIFLMKYIFPLIITKTASKTRRKKKGFRTSKAI